jgi:hypothetical protein
VALGGGVSIAGAAAAEQAGNDPQNALVVIAPPEQAAKLDQLFGPEATPSRDAGIFGEFSFAGEVPFGRVAAFYEIGVPDDEA